MTGNQRKQLFAYIAAALLRFALMKSKYQNLIADRFEVSTPVNSWKRVNEALYLNKNNIDPYSDSKFHETPLFLFLYEFLLKFLSEKVIFVTLDVWTARVLYRVARKQMEGVYKEQEVNRDKAGRDAKNKFLRGNDFYEAPFCVALAYLFNPFIVANCVGMTTTVFNNLFLAFFLLCLVEGNLKGVFWLSLVSVQSLHSIVLLAPLLLNFPKRKERIVRATVIFILALIYLNYLTANSWTFFENTCGFLLTVPELQPNIGLYWYFFIEIFKHFSTFFLCCFHINATILYVIALSIKLRGNVLFLSFVLLSIATIFKPYPCVGDFGFVLSLLPLFPQLFSYMKYGFLELVILHLAAVLAPMFSYLWLYARLANANFYFGASLGISLAQILLLVDTLFAHTKREFFLKNKKPINFKVVLTG